MSFLTQNVSSPSFYKHYILNRSDVEQVELCRAYILPKIEEILADMRTIRQQVDKECGDKLQAEKNVSSKEYPIGYCKYIRDEVFSRIEENIENDGFPGVQAIAEFVENGGLVNKIWGVDSEKYFQNAIQLGSCILDVANDTVDPEKEPVVLYKSLKESPIKQLSNYEQFADVIEAYWGFYVVPNLYLPNLAPCVPFLCLRQDKESGFVVVQISDMMFHISLIDLTESLDPDAKHHFNLAHDFIFKSKYSNRRLPAWLQKHLLRPKTLATDLNQSLGNSSNEIGIKAVNSAFQVEPEFVRSVLLPEFAGIKRAILNLPIEIKDKEENEKE